MKKISKCQCCGDVKEVISYNGSESCLYCLSLDREGVGRSDILDAIMGKYDYRLRKDRKQYWKTRL